MTIREVLNLENKISNVEEFLPSYMVKKYIQHLQCFQIFLLILIV